VIKKGVEIGPGAGIGIFHNDETRAGMLNENRGRSGGDSRFRDDVLDLSRNFISSLSRGTDRQTGSVAGHERDLATRSLHSSSQASDVS